MFFMAPKTFYCGEIDLNILVGPCKFEISFIFVDILDVFNLVFRRQGLHTRESIPSSLHQKVKFISMNKLIFIMAKEDILVLGSTMVPLLTHIR